MGFRLYGIQTLCGRQKPQNLQTACSSAQNIMQNSLQQPEKPAKNLKISLGKEETNAYRI